MHTVQPHHTDTHTQEFTRNALRSAATNRTTTPEGATASACFTASSVCGMESLPLRSYPHCDRTRRLCCTHCRCPTQAPSRPQCTRAVRAPTPPATAWTRRRAPLHRTHGNSPYRRDCSSIPTVPRGNVWTHDAKRAQRATSEGVSVRASERAVACVPSRVLRRRQQPTHTHAHNRRDSCTTSKRTPPHQLITRTLLRTVCSRTGRAIMVACWRAASRIARCAFCKFSAFTCDTSSCSAAKRNLPRTVDDMWYVMCAKIMRKSQASPAAISRQTWCERYRPQRVCERCDETTKYRCEPALGVRGRFFGSLSFVPAIVVSRCRPSAALSG